MISLKAVDSGFDGSARSLLRSLLRNPIAVAYLADRFIRFKGLAAYSVYKVAVSSQSSGGKETP
jgi:hypothetical protein